MTWTYVFLRCNSGHYFRGSVCPFDGWFMEGFDDVVLAESRLRAAGKAVSVASLGGEGIPREVLSRVLVIEFGAEDAAFEALDPAGFLIEGEWTPIQSVGPGLK
jgi:hypothetical protein